MGYLSRLIVAVERIANSLEALSQPVEAKDEPEVTQPAENDRIEVLYTNPDDYRGDDFDLRLGLRPTRPPTEEE